MTRLLIAAVLAAFLVTPALADDKVWKYDDGPDDLGSLAGSKMHPQFGHPGFVSQEAWGAVFRPETSDYPLEIVGIELLMAAGPKAAEPAKMTLNGTLEIWNSKEKGADPKQAKPLWKVHTSDFFNPQTQKPGTPVQGNTVMKYMFTSTKQGDKPPKIADGNVWILFRVTTNAADKATYWGKTDCMKQTISGVDLGCGCQDLAALTDSSTTPKTQIMNIVWPLGTCSGSKAWKFVEDINNGLVQMKGDFRIRMITKGGGTSSSSGGSSSGGSSSGGTVDAGTPPEDTAGGEKDAGTPPAKPVINLVTPAEGSPDKITKITIIGSDFMQGAKVLIGSKSAAVDNVTETKIEASVLPGLTPGVYPVIVENPNGQTGFKDNAFTIKEAPKEVDAGVDSGGGSFNPGGKLEVEGLTPNVVKCDQDTSVTIYGGGFTSQTEFSIGGTALLAVNIESDTKATGLIPKGFSRGKHSLIAKQGSASVAKANAVEVTCTEEGGCIAAPTPTDTTPMWAVGLLCLVALVVRRRMA